MPITKNSYNSGQIDSDDLTRMTLCEWYAVAYSTVNSKLGL